MVIITLDRCYIVNANVAEMLKHTRNIYLPTNLDTCEKGIYIDNKRETNRTLQTANSASHKIAILHTY